MMTMTTATILLGVRPIHLVTILVLLTELITITTSIKWLSMATLGGVDHISFDSQCDQLVGLVPKQKNICKKNVEIMEAVIEGARGAIGECQFQFRNRRWNCSTVHANASIFGKIINAGTRETAFVHAISSAGVANAVTRACSTGTIDRCGCDRSVQGPSRDGQFEWSGCSDNIAYGNAFAKTFVDARERVKGEAASKALMNLHNNNAGRKVIEDHMKVQCKCHGVSGSCEVKTCWRSMPPFRDVGTTLKDKFDGATEVEQKRIGSRRELVPKNDFIKQHIDSDLVYLDESPDFCEFDLKRGSMGTQGRLCNKTSKGLDGCELMCCGRGFHTRRKTVSERCNCKFHWCCSVKCSKCKRDIEEYICR